MADNKPALGEGPCGTGKSYAYCVPATLQAVEHRKRTVIVTANIALQEQLVQKDLARLAEVLPWPFTYALIKGRNNYLCESKLVQIRTGEPSVLNTDRSLSRQRDTIVDWSYTTQTGDVSELDFVPDPLAWSQFASTADDCLGPKCQDRAKCWSEKARTAAGNADIVVTNYHLLFAHLVVKAATGLDVVLPAFDHLVLDEAHEAANIAREFFGFSLSVSTFTRLAYLATDVGLAKQASTVRSEADALFAKLTQYRNSPRYKTRLTAPGFADVSRLRAAVASLGQSTNVLCEDGEDPKQQAQAAVVARTCSRLVAELEEGVELRDDAKVYYLDRDAKDRAKLCGKPVEVGPILEEALFGLGCSVSMVSATLTVAGRTDYMRRKLGVPDDALEGVVESPFDSATRAMLVIPPLHHPAHVEWAPQARAAAQQVLDTAGGRTLLLCTSLRHMKALGETLNPRGRKLLVQGEAPRPVLTRAFRADVTSTLIGCSSFWTGVDVPGESLVAVVIDKLPFPTPDDPVIDALCERNPRAFVEELVPLTALTLRQGVGRLLRAQTDYGVVVVLDSRLESAQYAHLLRKSLPAMVRSEKLDDVGPFLAQFEH